MGYRRKEPFRFQFQDPLKGTFKILQINGRNEISREGVALILDLSPNGIKFASPLNFPIDKLLMEVSFVINDKQIKMLVEPLWKKRSSVSTFTYGLVGVDDEETKREIIQELKEYSRRIHRTTEK